MRRRRRQTCHYCGSAVGDTMDHVVPRSMVRPKVAPQAFHEANLVPCCEPCNRRKSNKWPTHDCPLCDRLREWFATLPTR